MTARKPPDLKLLHGNPGNRPVTPQKSPTSEAPKPPADFKREAPGRSERFTTNSPLMESGNAVSSGRIATGEPPCGGAKSTYRLANDPSSTNAAGVFSPD